MMRYLFMVLAAIGACLSVSASSAAPDWSTVIGKTVNGNYVIGNPKAKVKLVEYLSYTCPHCAAFVAESGPVLRGQMVKSGSTRIELRNAIREKLDQTAALLARCAGPKGFVGATDAMFAQQPAWVNRGYAFLQANEARLEMYPESGKMRTLADASGLSELMKGRGMTDATIDACFANQAELATIVVNSDRNWTAMRAGAGPQGPGTPTFEVNGKVYGTTDWPALEKILRAAGAK
uniref:thioredoxin domain-containing protein n=1 Tax=Sphingomonas bacterium TaxID=1895847 RepID=UPI0026270BDC|nr:thioredoxin domain-containing protein [Sphingomonas bacterium]